MYNLTNSIDTFFTFDSSKIHKFINYNEIN